MDSSSQTYTFWRQPVQGVTFRFKIRDGVRSSNEFCWSVRLFGCIVDEPGTVPPQITIGNTGASVGAVVGGTVVGVIILLLVLSFPFILLVGYLLARRAKEKRCTIRLVIFEGGFISRFL